MQKQMEILVKQYERGRISRRALVAGLLALAGPAGAPSGAQQAVEIKPEGIDHVAFRVTSAERTAKFYQEQFGFTVRDQSRGSVFLNAGRQWIALFEQGVETTGVERPFAPGMDHCSFQVRGTFEGLMAELKRRNLKPSSPRGSGRIYFPDPDGILLQLTYR